MGLHNVLFYSSRIRHSLRRPTLVLPKSNLFIFDFFLVAAAYSYFNLGESSSSSDDEDYSPEDWKKVW